MGYEGSSTLVAPAIGIAVVDVVPGEFNSLMIGVASDATGKKPEVCKFSSSFCCSLRTSAGLLDYVYKAAAM